MKSIMKFFFSGLVGFFVVYGLMNFSEINLSGEITVISLIAISIILMFVSMLRFLKIKSLNRQNLNGDEEDEIEDRKYKMFTDYSLCTNSSFFLFILALSLSFILTNHLILTIAPIIGLIITSYLIHRQMYLMQQVSQDREFPLDSGPKSILDLADDGEKHVILDGLFKSQILLNFSLITAIALSTIYSVSQGGSQTFSIILMALILLAVNSKYMFVVRNR